MLWKPIVENRVCVANRCEEHVNVPTVAVGCCGRSIVHHLWIGKALPSQCGQQYCGHNSDRPGPSHRRNQEAQQSPACQIYLGEWGGRKTNIQSIRTAKAVLYFFPSRSV